MVILYAKCLGNFKWKHFSFTLNRIARFLPPCMKQKMVFLLY